MAKVEKGKGGKGATLAPQVRKKRQCLKFHRRQVLNINLPRD